MNLRHPNIYATFDLPETSVNSNETHPPLTLDFVPAISLITGLPTFNPYAIAEQHCVQPH